MEFNNVLNFKDLITENFFNKIIPNTIIDEDLLKIIIRICYSKCAFSTLPYFFDNMDSHKSIKKTNTGNCIALSLFIKDYLKKNFNINSYLIPASIPMMYQKENFLKLSHVAIAIPRNKKKVYILDPAFYFFSPILINLNKKKTPQIIDSMNIYENKISYVEATTKLMDMDTYFNKYQTIPKNTLYSHCNYIDNINDTWDYFLTEIKNPDQAISNFYLNTSEPFISTTKFNEDGYCNMHVYFKLYSPDYLLIKIDNGNYYSGHPNDITIEQLDYVASLIPGMYIRDLNRYIYLKKKFFDL